MGEVNPARAGMIPSLPPIVTCSGGKPRASGDDPTRGNHAGAGYV